MGLEKATIIIESTGEQIPVMFNPEEYTLETGNTFAEVGIPGLQASPVQYVRGNLRTLTMDLFFDTYEQVKKDQIEGVIIRRDVRQETRRITKLLKHEGATKAPPVLLFSWGNLNFRCVLEGATQRFTMFLEDGRPVRATLSVRFKEFEPVEIEIERGFFIGPPIVHNVIKGETLSQIAGEALGDPRNWRELAEANNIDNPFDLPTGQPLILPTQKPKPPR